MVDTYWFTLPYQSLPQMRYQFSMELGLRDFRGGFEFIGTREFIEAMVDNRKFLSRDYPPELWNQNGPLHTVFAVERQNLLAPVPNVTVSEAAALASTSEALWEKFLYVSLLRCYLTWPTDRGELSRASRGQHLSLFLEKGKFGIEIGVEQYADEDVAVRRLVRPIEALAKELGGSLKRGRSYT